MTDAIPAALDDQLAARLLQQRIIVFGTELDDRLGNRICTELLLLAAEDPTADISLWINSPGGSVPAMLAIADVMRLVPNDVRTVAMGMAASAGQFVLSGGTPGKRFALPHSRILMHQGSSGIGGTAGDIELQAQDLRTLRDTVLGLIADHTGQPFEKILTDSQRDRWWTAEQARDYGFVDAVVSSVADVHPHRERIVGLSAKQEVASA
ncbi:ATP-dependent Clp protease proteolytic subunit [Tessaracoccus terricola]